MERVKEMLDVYADVSAKCNMVIEMNMGERFNAEARVMLVKCMVNAKELRNKALNGDCSETHIEHLGIAIEVDHLFVACMYEKNAQSVYRP